MAIDKSTLTCKNCRYFSKSGGYCRYKEHKAKPTGSAICPDFFPDGICCRYCQFFKSGPNADLFSAGFYLKKGTCVRAGLNFDRNWYDYCESFERHMIETVYHAEEDEVSMFREDGTLKASFKDFPELLKQNSQGCYIATAVYGSYDCPEVWTLRRYRDQYLARSLCGRLFIKLYYLISPPLVKIFGNSRLFQIFWRKKLNKLISKLQKSGIESTPYED